MISDRALFITGSIAASCLLVFLFFFGGYVACDNGGGTLQKPLRCVEPVVIGACELNDRIYVTTTEYVDIGGLNG